MSAPRTRPPPAGRQAYLDKRREAIHQRAGIVEIDLVLQGKPTLTYSREGLPEFDHAVSVTRATAPDRYEIYTATLQKRLPKFKLPLAPDDRDTLLDLQSAFTRAYDLGGFSGQIDYKSPPPADVPITDVNQCWIDDLLKQMKAAVSRLRTARNLAVGTANGRHFLGFSRAFLPCPTFARRELNYNRDGN